MFYQILRILSLYGGRACLARVRADSEVAKEAGACRRRGARKRARHCLGAWRVRGIAFFGFRFF